MSRVSRFRPEGKVVMRPQWSNLLFLHWEFEPALVQKLLPAGLELDLFEGRAYVGLVPFQMAEVRPHFIPNLGKWGHFHSRFPEMNVRTYVVRDGIPGVWFFSLDAASSLAVITARLWFCLPYFKARMRVRETQGGFDYWSKRLWPAPFEATCRVRYTPSGSSRQSEPDSLEEFLVERYVLYSQRGKQLFRGRVFHEPYPIQGAKVQSLRESCLRAAGFKRPDQKPHVLFSRGVDVEVWGLEKC
ncbi:hypothetical protein IAD21_01472 [Abditibacteriota bacterium]|nr:hypothetical protein IAD21_01472 [Abditibacteriota bacterium]